MAKKIEFYPENERQERFEAVVKQILAYRPPSKVNKEGREGRSKHSQKPLQDK